MKVYFRANVVLLSLFISLLIKDVVDKTNNFLWQKPKLWRSLEDILKLIYYFNI